MKKETKNDEIKRHLSSLAEHFEGKVQIVAEGFFDLKKDITGLKKDMTEVKSTLKSHSEVLKSHTEMIGQVLVNLAEVKGELKQKVDYTDFAKLEKRVAYLEARR